MTQKKEPDSKRRPATPIMTRGLYTPEEIEFMTAMDRYKRARCRPFPTWQEVLDVLISLGYRKVEKPTSLPQVRSLRGK